MTLRNRNRLFMGIFCAACALLLLNIICWTISIIQGNFQPPQNSVRIFKSFQNLRIFKYDYIYVVLCIFLFSVSIPVLSIIIYLNFNKTPCLEIFFFCGFMLACLLEQMRLYISLFNLWKTSSLLYLTLGKAIMTGRVLAPLSFLFSTLFVSTEDRQYAERNFSIMIVTSIVFGSLFPLDTEKTTSSCAILWSYRLPFRVFTHFLILSAVSVLFVHGWLEKVPELYKLAVGIVILMLGYSFLREADCLGYFAIGTVLCILGATYYLKCLHKLYD